MNLILLLHASLLLSLAVVSASEAADNNSTKVFNVKKYGAISDGQTDNVKAFERAWSDACAWDGRQSKLAIPKGEYLVGQWVLKGPCKCRKVVVQVTGDVLAPTDLNAFKTKDWISFQYIDGLILTGKGKFDGRGASAWPHNNCHKTTPCRPLPWSLNFSFVSNATIRGITSVDSKNVHMQIYMCRNMRLHSFRLEAPEDSPNTDGIHVGESSDIIIDHANISTGDDCVSVGPATANLSITHVRCGPGHGISIGSLGAGKGEGDVTGIRVRNCTFEGTDNGVRIKTWRESPSSSSAYDLIFEDLIMKNVSNPIIIDQKYCPHNLCNAEAGPSRVKIRGVKFRNIRGETRTKNAINLVCSDVAPCEDVELSDIYLENLSAEPAEASCFNVRGRSTGIMVPPSCI